MIYKYILTIYTKKNFINQFTEKMHVKKGENHKSIYFLFDITTSDLLNTHFLVYKQSKNTIYGFYSENIL